MAMKNILFSVPRTLSHCKNTITNPCEIAKVFNNYFASVANATQWALNIAVKTFLNT